VDWYVESFLSHEFSHALWTEKIETIQELLKTLSIPFHYFNIFEDARIEHLFRDETKRTFKWSFLENIKNEFNEPDKFDISPLDIYFYFIYSENGIYDDNINPIFLKHLKSKGFYKEVETFYKRTIETKECLKVIPIIKEFYDKYKNEKDEEESPSSTFEFEFSLEGKPISGPTSGKKKKKGEKGDISDNEKDLDKSVVLILDSTVNENELNESGEELNNIIDEGNLKEYNSVSVENIKSRLVSESEMVHDLFKKEIIKHGEMLYTQALKKIFRKHFNTFTNEKFSKRFNATKLVLDRDDIYSHKIESKNGGRNKRKKLSLIVDVSGSMQGISTDILTVLYVFNRLTQNNVINFNLFLSGGGGTKAEATHLKTPLKTNEIFKIMFRSGIEGLDNCFKTYEKELQKSEIIFVLTDGDIVDVPLNKKGLNDKGIYTRAIYVLKGKKNPEYERMVQKRMEKYFDEYIMKDSIDAIFEEIILKYKKL
jgi:hypothetical protein